MESHSKVCSKCKKDKPRTEFHKSIKERDGLAYYCKVCRSKVNKEWKQENPDYYKKWHQNNRDYRSEYNKKWVQDNRDYRNEYVNKWRQENRDYREKHAARMAKRRASKRGNTPKFIFGYPKEKVRVEQVYKLRDLLTKVTGIEYHVDHIWPLSKGGPHWSGNLQIIPAEENLAKGDTLCKETARVIQESLDEYISTRQRE